MRGPTGPLLVNPGSVDNLLPKLRREIYDSVHIALQNIGGLPIAAGTHVHWALQNGIQGDHPLAPALAPMQAMLLETPSAGPSAPATTCVATIG